jgi:phosphoenolpyruvate---glycerone phosphotransferase subunit DhaL
MHPNMQPRPLVGDQLDLAGFRLALLDTCDGVVNARDELIRLDAVAGDGDLGATLATGFTAVRTLLETQQFEDVGTMLTALGRELGRRAPSTLGTLLAGAFGRMGTQVKGVLNLSPEQLTDALSAAAEAVADRGGVTVGQRTVLDAMEPSARAAAAAAAEGSDVATVASRAAQAARQGAADTARMSPQVGRAAWIGDRVIGEPDAGATAWAVILDAFAAGVARQRAATVG